MAKREQLIKDVNQLVERYLNCKASPIKGLHGKTKGELERIKNKLGRAVSLQNQARAIEDMYKASDWQQAILGYAQEDVLSAYNRSKNYLMESTQLWLEFKRNA